MVASECDIQATLLLVLSRHKQQGHELINRALVNPSEKTGL